MNRAPMNRAERRRSKKAGIKVEPVWPTYHFSLDDFVPQDDPIPQDNFPKPFTGKILFGGIRNGGKSRSLTGPEVEEFLELSGFRSFIEEATP